MIRNEYAIADNYSPQYNFYFVFLPILFLLLPNEFAFNYSRTNAPLKLNYRST